VTGAGGLLLADDDLRARLAANARQSSEKYDVQRTAAQMADLYQEIVQEYRARQALQEEA